MIAGDAATRAVDVTADSRVAHPGSCFVALVAERDGHEFVADAWARGATVALVARPVGAPPAGAAAIQVDDPLVALGRLAAAARERELPSALVVGITGSAGKTATKDLTAAGLAASRRVHESHASYNNEVGVPVTLLGAPADVEALVLEMGARAVGDIAVLCEIARPNVGVITNIGLAHVGRFGDRATIARAKGELLEALPAEGLAVIRVEDDREFALGARTAARRVAVAVGDGDGADVRADAVELDDELRPTFRLHTPWGSGIIRLGLRGAHQVANAALAATVALAHDVPFAALQDALAGVDHAAWRMEVTHTHDGIVVINDAYNANPGSVAAALDALVGLPGAGRRVAVLGDMRELGEHSVAEHAAIGDLVARLPVDVLVAVGDEVAPMSEHAAVGRAAVTHVADAAAAVAVLERTTRPGDVVLVKGSRALGLERVAQALLELEPEGAA